MTAVLHPLLAYVVAWITGLTIATIAVRGGSERFKVNPFMILVRFEASFEKLSRLRRNRAVGYILSLGIAVLMLSAGYFYATIVARLLTALHAKPQPILIPIVPGVTISPKTFIYMLPGFSLGVIAHELMHAVAARYEGIRVRFAGFFVVLGLIPAAFIEPDEEDLKRANTLARLRVYSAGVLANITLSLLLILMLHGYLSQGAAIYITSVKEGSPASKAGIHEGLLVKTVYINETYCGGFTGFITCMSRIASKYNGTENVALKITFHLPSGNKTITVLKPKGEKYVGITFIPIPLKLVELGFNPNTAYKIYLVTELALAINLGLAFINSIPLFITDGAQFIRTLLSRMLGEERAGVATFALSTITLLLLIPLIYVP